VRCRRDRDQAFLFGIPVEARHGAQPARDRSAGSAERLEVTGEAFDVGATRPEQRHSVFGAPGDVLARVEGVGLASQAAVAGQDPASASCSLVLNNSSRVTSAVLVKRGTSTMEPPGVEPRLQRPGPVKQPQQSSEAADHTSDRRERSRAGILGACRATVTEPTRGIQT
jgi:hypothetical protein